MARPSLLSATPAVLRSTQCAAFILRGVKLVGIDSVMQPYEKRVECWNKVPAYIPLAALEEMVEEAKLEDMISHGKAILKGQMRGRVIVNPSAVEKGVFMSYQIALGPRVRKSPFFDSTAKTGVTHFTIYNHMYMPVSYGDLPAEYDRLMNGVSMWDVAAERQVALKGPDAVTLARYLTPRNLENLRFGIGKYCR